VNAQSAWHAEAQAEATVSGSPEIPISRAHARLDGKKPPARTALPPLDDGAENLMQPSARENVLRWLGNLDGKLTGEAVIDRQPPTIREQWAGHAKAAQRHNAAIARHPRYLWGVMALVLRLAWDAFEACVLRSPPFAVVSALVVAALWFWLI
jgi:hypothetical protein